MATFYNRATLTYNNETINSNTVVGEIVEVLTVTKTAVGGEYSPGESVVYAVSITNSSAAPFTNLSLIDDLGQYTFGADTLYPLTYTEGSLLYYINGTLQPTLTPDSGPPLTVTGITVPAGGNATLIYEARANSFAPVSTGGVITNTVTLAGAGVGDNVSDAETVNVREAADLTITKSLTPGTVPQNGTLTYTLTIENTGNAPAEGTVSVSDVFDPILSDVTVTYNGLPLPENTGYTYNEATGEFSTVPGAITVPAASYSQDPDTGVWSVTPGVAVITVTGTI